MSSVHSSGLVRKIFSVASIRGASAIFAFLLSWMIVRHFSLEALGSFSFALVTVQLAGALSLLGIDSLLLRLMMKASSAGKPRRSEERRVGKEGVSTCRSRWSQVH